MPTGLLSKSVSGRGDLAVALSVWTGINQLTLTVLFINPVAVLSPGPCILPLLGNLRLVLRRLLSFCDTCYNIPWAFRLLLFIQKHSHSWFWSHCLCPQVCQKHFVFSMISYPAFWLFSRIKFPWLHLSSMAYPDLCPHLLASLHYFVHISWLPFTLPSYLSNYQCQENRVHLCCRLSIFQKLLIPIPNRPFSLPSACLSGLWSISSDFHLLPIQLTPSIPMFWNMLLYTYRWDSTLLIKTKAIKRQSAALNNKRQSPQNFM